MQKRKVRNILISAAVAGLVLPPFFGWLVLATDWPLGGRRGAWEWLRVEVTSGRLEHCLVALAAFAAAALLAWRLDSTPDLRRGAKLLWMLAALAGCSLVADLALLNNGRAGVTESAVAILNPFATGYLEMALTAEKPGDLSANFNRRVLTPAPGEIPLHRHVHPPGNVLLAAAVLKVMPSGMGAALLPGAAADLRELAAEHVFLPPMDRPVAQRAALNLTILFIAALTAGKVLILASLIRLRIKMPGLAALFVLFGSGAALLFLGHYDVFYFFLTALGAFFAVSGLRSGKPVWALATGVALGLLASFSLGAGAVILLAAIVFGCSPSRRRLLPWFAAGGLAVLAVFALAGVPLVSAALQSWENHRAFCASAGRSYWPWVGFNAFDALLFCGVPASLLIFGVFGLRRRHFAYPPLLAAALIWLFLIFSGSARGEFGRLAALYTPVLLVGGGYLLGRYGAGFYRLFLPVMLFAFLQIMLLRDTLKLILIE
ncbi:MAG: hypothetical protein AB7F32_07315 [Victivallaceae bacterium]